MKRFLDNIDYIGTALASLCALHCILIPILISLSAYTITDWISNPAVQWSFIITGFVIALAAAYRGYLQHRNSGILWLISIGFLLLAGAEYLPHVIHLPVSLSGGFMVVMGHMRNRKLMLTLATL